MIKEHKLLFKSNQEVNIVISIIGFGNIGKFLSTQLLHFSKFNFTLNLIDSDPKVKGAILDLEHAAQLYPNHQIAFNSQELLNTSDFIFHCAGASVPIGKNRLAISKESIEN